MADHGGAGTKYAHEGCRCDLCREAHRARIARRRAERDVSKYEGPHGVPSTYKNWRCRCEPCKAAWSVEMKRQFAARKAKRDA
ncbi:MAG: hypothetical protein ACYC6C_10295 [Coriobacteriia bacterium]